MAAPQRPTVQLYHAEVAAFDTSDWGRLVTAEDLAALPLTAHPRRRAEHLAGRALLRVALEAWTGRPALSHRLRVAATGKPECVDGPELSVAHSRGAVVCALGPEGAIGIDIELPVPGRAVDGIGERYFSAEESRWADDQPDRFYMLWVLKEAYLKALGVGLAGGLDALCCEIEPPLIEATVRGSAEVPALALYGAASGFIGVATFCRRAADVTAFRWAPGEPLSSTPLRLVARTIE